MHSIVANCGERANGLVIDEASMAYPSIVKDIISASSLSISSFAEMESRSHPSPLAPFFVISKLVDADTLANLPLQSQQGSAVVAGDCCVSEDDLRSL